MHCAPGGSSVPKAAIFLERKKGRWYSSCVALNIKDPETDRLARQLAELTGESITTATRTAIEQRLARERRRSATTPTQERLLAIVRRGRARPRLDDRSAEEILGYDEHGLPR